MTINNWEEYGKTANFTLDDSLSNEGNGSLYTPNQSDPGALIVPGSVTDSPVEARIETDAYPQEDFDDTTAPAGFFRFQDMNNFYLFMIGVEDSNLDSSVQLHKVESGSHSMLEEIVIGGGHPYPDQWVNYRMDCWEQSGEVRFRMSEDADGDGTYTQVETDLTDTDPSFGTGGGIGIGNADYSGSAGGTCNYDQTEVYY